MSRERRTLQPWTKWSLHDPGQGWLAWKVEDQYVPGVPDFIVKSPISNVSVLELKWSSLKTSIRFEASREQWAHLREWGSGAYMLVATQDVNIEDSSRPGAIVLVPAAVLGYTNQTLTVPEVLALDGVVICEYFKPAMKEMLRHRLL